MRFSDYNSEFALEEYDVNSDHSERYALGRLVLDYLRTLLWPAVVLGVVLIYQDDVRKILETREVKVAGVFELGQQVAQIEDNTSEELADIGSLLAALRARSGAEVEVLVSDIESKLSKVEQNLNKQVEEIQVAQQQVQLPVEAPAKGRPSSPTDVETADDFERRGFEALLAQDVKAAMNAFEAAYARWPTYHNVDEIRKLLQQHQRALAEHDPDAWATVYRAILSDYSWGMPKDLRPEYRERAVASYGG